jgi:hypothetical protein
LVAFSLGVIKDTENSINFALCFFLIVDLNRGARKRITVIAHDGGVTLMQITLELPDEVAQQFGSRISRAKWPWEIASGRSRNPGDK